MEQVDLLLFQSERRAIYRGDGSGTESTGARGEGVEGYGQRDRRWERLQREPTFTGLRRGITGLPCFENEVKAIAAGWYSDVTGSLWKRAEAYGGGRLPEGCRPVYPPGTFQPGGRNYPAGRITEGDVDDDEANEGLTTKCSLPCYSTIGHAIVAGWHYDGFFGCWYRSPTKGGGGRLPRGYDPFYDNELPDKWRPQQ